ncbi:hypothetical protein L218DRAFT_766392 [Marasmius fiardii PR-910]|nr:hypothetical protein L218DRAFT_766392 [Marasmius fiardii PR-910]
MDRRQTLCGTSSGVGVNWRDLGRNPSQGLVNLPGHNTQGHDVEEWKRYGPVPYGLDSETFYLPLGIPRIKLRSRLSMVSL